jgi:predicted transcriptional regulator
MVKKRIPMSLKVDPELWEKVKIMALRTKKNITEYFEDALREKLIKDYEIVAAEKKRKEQEQPEDFVAAGMDEIKEPELELLEQLRQQQRQHTHNHAVKKEHKKIRGWPGESAEEEER